MAHMGTASHSPDWRFFTAPLNTQESRRAWIVGLCGRVGDLRGVHEIVDAEADRMRLPREQGGDELGGNLPREHQPTDVRRQARR